MQMTVAAQEALSQFIQAELMDGEFVRVARAFQCGGSRFQLVVDNEITAMDERFAVADVIVVIDKSCLTLLANTVVDYGGAGFLFEDNTATYC